MVRTFADVIEHLRSRPHVSMICPSGRITFAEGRHTFLELADGLMWFVGPDGVKHHLPVDCGKTAAESSIRVGPAGFDLTKFGITICVRFWEARAPWAVGDMADELARNWELPRPGELDDVP